jgi:hypothetical protein
MGTHRRVALRLLLAATLLGPPAQAQRELSAYEEGVVRELEHAVGSVRDPAPEGKWIESVIVHRLDVFDQRDPVPDFVNWFHAKTRAPVVERELLLGVGERFTADVAAESERNLREIYQLSLVLVIPLRGSQPDRVRLAVVTKDVWSLRASWDPVISREGFVSSRLAVDEINVAGRLKTASLQGGFDPGSYWYGVRYVDPRVAGSRQFALAGAQLVFDRESGEPEGSFGNLWYGQDLYSLETKWAYEAFVGWRRDTYGSYRGGALRTFDARATPYADELPLEWRQAVYFSRYDVWRSFGSARKLDVGLGMEALRGEYALPAGLEGAPVALAELRRHEVPPNHQRIGPMLGVHAYSTRYLRTLDVDTLALQEDVALGHDLFLRVFPASETLGSSRNLVGIAASAGYTLRLGDGFVRAGVGSVVEVAGSRDTDAVAEATLHVASPRLGIGRVVYDATLIDRLRDYHHERLELGGENRLRGYPIGRLRGPNLAAGTLEFRTTSVGLFGVELGGAAFCDVADAPEHLTALAPRASVGVGARVLFPMFDRSVFRVDVGFPLERGVGVVDPPVGYTMSFYQAVPTPRLHRSLVPAAVTP